MNQNDWKEELVRALSPTDRTELDIHRAQEISELHIPSKIYRFRSVSQYAFKELCTDTVWMTPPENYNDPYDSAAAIYSARFSSVLSQSAVDSFLSSDYANERLTEEDMEAVRASGEPLRTLLWRMPDKDSLGDDAVEKIAELFSKFYGRFSNMVANNMTRINKSGMRVCSFTENWDSIVMWSHYGDSHKGICIEYTLEGLPASAQPRLLLYPVIYKDELFDISPHLEQVIRGGDFNNLIPTVACLHKSTEWEHECEWRLVVPLGDDNTDGFDLQMPTPTQVILGARISEKDERDIRDIAGKRKIGVSKIGLSSSAFELDVTGQLREL